ncbi:MAG TPA: acyl-CoA dehydrogenase family protein [Bryobacteraceae bacterium]|nr:acyl-CoA dehydrogenase family protein [Bryobacteraceae bacterium]
MATASIESVEEVKTDKVKRVGGGFLIEDQKASEIFTPEDLTPEHREIARAAREFFEKEVAPNVDAIVHGDRDLAVSLLRKAASLGFESILTPERYGGMELDLASSMVVAEELARDGSFAGWHGAHAGIGTMPLLLFGTEEQKQKYLPRLSTAELVAAYCLTEPHAGSDALAARTRADLSPDGRHYILNGQKMWITNGGKADLFTVFAKIGGEQFSAFLVERAFPGVSSGNEEHKMGIKGSSTTAVYFDNVPVPVENLLGEPGRGHIIAFNILNLGRLKLGPFAVGGSKNILRVATTYAKQRKAFGSAIAQFGMIQSKLAEMAIRIFAIESISYRVEGLIQGYLEGFSWNEPDAARRFMKAIEEFAAECSMVKVYASEALDYVVDEGVQIHGGYGYHQDYAVEKAYRDSRINRIFEGTNEINRLLIPGMMLKRAQQGRLGLVKAAKALMDEVLAGPSLSETASEERRLVTNAKKIGLLLLATAFEKFGTGMEKQQEVLAGIADVLMETFAMESCLLRVEKSGQREGAMYDMRAVFLRDAMARIEAFARPVLAACAEGDTLRSHLAVLRRFAKYQPVNSIGLRRRIAEKLVA